MFWVKIGAMFVAIFQINFLALKYRFTFQCRFSKDSKVPHSTTNISAIERNFSQCTSLCHFVFSSSEKETLFSKEVVNQSEDYVDAPWSPTHEVECTYRSSSFTFSKNDSLMTL